jgi:hypothetical protein
MERTAAQIPAVPAVSTALLPGAMPAATSALYLYSAALSMLLLCTAAAMLILHVCVPYCQHAVWRRTAVSNRTCTGHDMRWSERSIHSSSTTTTTLLPLTRHLHKGSGCILFLFLLLVLQRH